MDCNPSGLLSTGFSSRQEHWSGLPRPSPPGDLPDAGIEQRSLVSPALAGGFFTTSATWHTDGGPETQGYKNGLEGELQQKGLGVAKSCPEQVPPCLMGQADEGSA